MPHSAGDGSWDRPTRQFCTLARGTAVATSVATTPGTRVHFTSGERDLLRIAMNFSLLCRFWVAVPVLCDLFRGVHAFAFNTNGGVGAQAGARRRGLDRRLDREVERSSGVALPRRAQVQATVEMSAGTRSAWSWSQAAATALAAMQVCMLGTCTQRSVDMRRTPSSCPRAVGCG